MEMIDFRISFTYTDTLTHNYAFNLKTHTNRRNKNFKNKLQYDYQKKKNLQHNRAFFKQNRCAKNPSHKI